MDEQQATDKLESLVGSVDKCFRLMRLYRSCCQATSGNRLFEYKPISTDDLFRQRAKQDGYSPAAINHYLNYIR